LSENEFEKLWNSHLSKPKLGSEPKQVASAGLATPTPQREHQPSPPALLAVTSKTPTSDKAKVDTNKIEAATNEKAASTPVSTITSQSVKSSLVQANNPSVVQTQDAREVKTLQEQDRLQEQERLQLTKAAEYVPSIPTDNKTLTASLVDGVAAKLHNSDTTNKQFGSEDVIHLKDRLVSAVQKYINSLEQNTGNQKSAQYVENILTTSDGSFPQICAKFALTGVVKVNNADNLAGLCKTIVACIIEDEVGLPSVGLYSKLGLGSPKVTEPSTGPKNGAATWPAQEKREKGELNTLYCKHCAVLIQL
jgi:hypothetical protein